MSVTAPGFERALATCAAEPIHIIGAIQPSGVLLAWQASTGKVVAASRNAAALFEMDSAEGIVGQPVQHFIDETTMDAVRRALQVRDPRTAVFAGLTNAGPMGELHEVATHQDGDLVHVELEPAASMELPGDVHLAVAALEADGSVDQLLQSLAQSVQRLSGFSRVMVYRFLRDHCGEVLAEAIDGPLPSYLGLRYPASDIPPQARALYLRNPVRVISDVGAEPVPVVCDASLDGPLDMSLDALRAVSPVHLQYLRNMGVTASMSISLVVDGRLWGLVACHHHAPRHVGARMRQALQMLGRHAAMILDARDLRSSVRREDQLAEHRDQLERVLHHARDPLQALGSQLDLAAAATGVDGAALYVDGRWIGWGSLPDTGGLAQALAWAQQRSRTEPSFSQRGADWCEEVQPAACGLAVLPLAARDSGWLMLFRREQRETVRWAGRPDQPFQVDADGAHIGPRTSFAAWEEQVRGCAGPWSERDVERARRLRLVVDRYLR